MERVRLTPRGVPNPIYSAGSNTVMVRNNRDLLMADEDYYESPGVKQGLKENAQYYLENGLLDTAPTHSAHYLTNRSVLGMKPLRTQAVSDIRKDLDKHTAKNLQVIKKIPLKRKRTAPPKPRPAKRRRVSPPPPPPPPQAVTFKIPPLSRTSVLFYAYLV